MKAEHGRRKVGSEMRGRKRGRGEMGGQKGRAAKFGGMSAKHITCQGSIYEWEHDLLPLGARLVFMHSIFRWWRTYTVLPCDILFLEAGGHLFCASKGRERGRGSRGIRSRHGPVLNEDKCLLVHASAPFKRFLQTYSIPPPSRLAHGQVSAEPANPRIRSIRF
jgi:hypothetical protein